MPYVILVRINPAPKNTSEARRIRRRNFGPGISFFAPSIKKFETAELSQSCDCFFPAVSITGSNCQLKCDHCRGHILKWMTPTLNPHDLIQTAGEYAARGAAGILVSGGSLKDGTVPLNGFLEAMARIKSSFGLKVIVHTGITSLLLAHGLADAGIDAALIDVLGSMEAIKGVCHLDGVSPADYARSLENLCETGLSVIPHIVIGINYGKTGGECEALDTVARYPVQSLVLIGLMPQRGTPMENAAPPSPQEMGEIFLRARMLMPRTPIFLGCERPAGDHKAATDKLALEAGLNGIAYPAEGTVALAKKMGLQPVFSELCCAIGINGGEPL